MWSKVYIWLKYVLLEYDVEYNKNNKNFSVLDNDRSFVICRRLSFLFYSCLRILIKIIPREFKYIQFLHSICLLQNLWIKWRIQLWRFKLYKSKEINLLDLTSAILFFILSKLVIFLYYQFYAKICLLCLCSSLFISVHQKQILSQRNHKYDQWIWDYWIVCVKWILAFYTELYFIKVIQYTAKYSRVHNSIKQKACVCKGWKMFKR